MVSRRAYKRVKVNSIDLVSLAAVAKAEKSAVLGLDIAKGEIVACARWHSGEFERPWSIENPMEIGDLVKICQTLIHDGLDLKVAMESTGTYGDAVRLALTNAKIAVFRVSGKGVSDYKEIFDGVPSQHDGKDAAMIAELCSMGKGTSWPYELASDFMAEVSFQVQRMDAFQSEYVQWHGRLEAQITRFWPELCQYSKMSNITTLKLLCEYGSPSAICKSDKASSQLLKLGKGKLSEARVEHIIQSAATTVGIPMNPQNVKWVQEICERVLAAGKNIAVCKKQLSASLKQDAFWSQYVDAVGAGTLGAILSTVGDPRAYSSAGALLKASGLNLKERSSGKRIGEKAITKRGPSLLRRWLFFWAMRAIQRDELSEWYLRFHSSGFGHRDRPTSHRKMKGLICMMRKLIRSLWSSMQQGTKFEYSKVIQKTQHSTRRRRKTKKPEGLAVPRKTG